MKGLLGFPPSGYKISGLKRRNVYKIAVGEIEYPRLGIGSLTPEFSDSKNFMPSEQSSDVKFEISHVLFIDIVGYTKLLTKEQHALLKETDTH